MVVEDGRKISRNKMTKKQLPVPVGEGRQLFMCAGHGTILAGESPVMGNLPPM